MFCARNCVLISLVRSAAELEVCWGQAAWLNGATGQFVALKAPGESNRPTTPGPGEGVPNTLVSAESHTPGIRQLSYRNMSTMRNLSVTAYAPDQSAFTETRLVLIGPPAVLPRDPLRAVQSLTISERSEK